MLTGLAAAILVFLRLVNNIDIPLWIVLALILVSVFFNYSTFSEYRKMKTERDHLKKILDINIKLFEEIKNAAAVSRRNSNEHGSKDEERMHS